MAARLRDIFREIASARLSRDASSSVVPTRVRRGQVFGAVPRGRWYEGRHTAIMAAQHLERSVEIIAASRKRDEPLPSLRAGRAWESWKPKAPTLLLKYRRSES